MTMLSSVSAVALAFGPHLVYYNATPLSDYDAIGACWYGAFAYLGTLAVKMALLAFLQDATAANSTLSLVLSGALGLLDVSGLWYALVKLCRSLNLSIEHKFQGTALGWSFADALCTRLLPFLATARSPEYTPQHFISALQANLTLLHTLSFACVCSLLWLKRNKPEEMSFILRFWVLVHAILPLGVNVLEQRNLPRGIIMWVQLGVAAVLALAAWRLQEATKTTKAA